MLPGMLRMGMVRLVCCLLPAVVVAVPGRRWWRWQSRGRGMPRSEAAVGWFYGASSNVWLWLALACLPSRPLFRPGCPMFICVAAFNFNEKCFLLVFVVVFVFVLLHSDSDSLLFFGQCKKYVQKINVFLFFFPLEEMQIRISCTFPLERQKLQHEL